MTRPTTEWDPSWDDDWQTALQTLEEEMQEERPRHPEQAVELYKHGFSARRRQPSREWTQVESELYQEYMGGSPEPGAYEESDWEEAREWALRGWKSSK